MPGAGRRQVRVAPDASTEKGDFSMPLESLPFPFLRARPRNSGESASCSSLVLDIQRPRTKGEHFGRREQLIALFRVVVEEQLDAREFHRMLYDIVAV